MNKKPEDIDQLLPFGEQLRSFMAQSFVGKSDLKNVLRRRGVFTSDQEKDTTIPILSSTILSPQEFDYLRECQSTKEDNPKVITQTIEWQTENSLLDSVPENMDVNSILNLDYANYKVVGSPGFFPVAKNPDCIKMEFSVEREDMSKNWATNKSTFSGSVELKRVKEGKDVKLIVTHTANETRQVASKVSSELVKHFKDKGCIDPSKSVEKILFSRFSNPMRITYLLSLTENCNSHVLDFLDVVDIELSPDKDIPLPQSIDWMKQKIRDLRLNGNDLHKTFFMSDRSYHEALNFHRVDSKFKFDVKGATGTCVMSIGFPEYGRHKDVNAEMEVAIKTMSFDVPPKKISRSDIKQILLREIEDQKIANFRKYGLKSE